MPKLDKSQFTKSQWQAIRDQKRLEKSRPKITQPQVTYENEKYYVLCIKHGTKYSYEYVNRLYNMVKRNCSLEFEFICLTDNANGIHKDVKILSIPSGLTGWWCKPYMFSSDLQINGTILYMDLDVVIAGNIDKLFTYEPNNWCIIRDFTRKMRPDWKKYNSSVIRFRSGTLNHIWTTFCKDKLSHIRRHHGDQDFIYETDKSAVYFPDSWILSWKWEVRKSKEFDSNTKKGSRKLRYIEDVVPPKDCCITVFHGEPNPDFCDDPWVKQNWY